MMDKGRLTPREEELLHRLLEQKGITTYQLVDVINEGKQLPGSTFPLEIESMSGVVITPEKVYNFWLDWFDGHYFLGEEDGCWREIRIEELGRDKAEILQIQQRLRQRHSSNEKEELAEGDSP